jgi:chromosome partitioning protein
MRFLSSLKIPVVGVLRDSQNFVASASEGLGICDLPLYRSRKDLPAIAEIIAWLLRDGLARESAPVPESTEQGGIEDRPRILH